MMGGFRCDHNSKEGKENLLPSSKGVPKPIQVIAFIHLWSLLSCLVSLCGAELSGCSLEEDVEESRNLFCVSFNSSELYGLLETGINSLSLRDTPSLQIEEFLHETNSSGLMGLRILTIENCSLSEFELHGADFLPRLEELSLINNRLVRLKLSNLESLRVLNLSSNFLTQLAPLEGLHNLRDLDISHNLLDENLRPEAFQELSKTLILLNISGNKFHCSPKLSWIYDWNARRSVISESDSTQCHYDTSNNYNGNLLLVMEYYSKYINPSCPSEDGCICSLTSVQEKMVHSKDRTYSVQVNCARNGLNYFPKLPKHTRTVDLSGNLINGSAFEGLKVIEQNYDEVDNLTINDNKLESLPEKILEMRLGLSFSARNNKLKTISYDMSQRLVRTTTVVELSGNPWRCSCRSQITDVILIEKVRDKTHLVCGPDSDGQLQNEKIMSLNPQILCAPTPSGEIQETFLKLLCVLFSILIVIVFAKLGYDYWVYRTRGQLPWLVLKMP
eukprot:TRINITY_DN2441_c0_g1_i1.p1 TRINITY_DN2441_c0_g1~~TRINITY_DN2441_c0_g1_i1.p1  ORF type:complete len:502 (-),score=79.63 TRINITY_DN2441_c0_g1_i1:100-1605(-)